MMYKKHAIENIERKEIEAYIRKMIAEVMTSDMILNIKEESKKQIHFTPLELGDTLDILVSKQMKENNYIQLSEIVAEFLEMFKNNEISYSLVDPMEHFIIHKASVYPDNFTLIGDSSMFIRRNNQYISESILDKISKNLEESGMGNELSRIS